MRGVLPQVANLYLLEGDTRIQPSQIGADNPDEYSRVEAKN